MKKFLKRLPLGEEEPRERSDDRDRRKHCRDDQVERDEMRRQVEEATRELDAYAHARHE